MNNLDSENFTEKFVTRIKSIVDIVDLSYDSEFYIKGFIDGLIADHCSDVYGLVIDKIMELKNE